MTESTHLSRRETQIMEILYERGRASAAEVHTALPDPPSYSAVRATLRILEEKGHVQHQSEGQRYVFCPMVPREEARGTALKKMVRTFFGGSPEHAMAALLDLEGQALDGETLNRLADLIERNRQEGR